MIRKIRGLNEKKNALKETGTFREIEALFVVKGGLWASELQTLKFYSYRNANNASENDFPKSYDLWL